MADWLFNVILDKFGHFMVSAVIVCIAAVINMAEWNRPWIVAATTGAVFSLSLGCLKEIVWRFIIKRKRLNIKVLCADFAGVVIGFLLALTILAIWNV